MNLQDELGIAFVLDDLADAYENQGYAYSDQDRFDLAAKAFLQAVAMYSAIPDRFMTNLKLSDWANAYERVVYSYYRLALQSLDRRDRDQATHFLDSALEAWKAGYSILPNPDESTERLWRDVVRSKIESARRKARGK